MLHHPSAVLVAEGGEHPEVNGPRAQFGAEEGEPKCYKIDGSGNKLEGDKHFSIISYPNMEKYTGRHTAGAEWAAAGEYYDASWGPIAHDDDPWQTRHYYKQSPDTATPPTKGWAVCKFEEKHAPAPALRLLK